MTKHKNDIYSDDIASDKTREDFPEAIPAATVLLLREAADLEVLMLHKTSKIAFGGMWVFPGGRIDDEDHHDAEDDNGAARVAARRETMEEAGIDIPSDEFVWFSHWTPPPSTAKRFATWFFVTGTDKDHDVVIDGGEIQNHQWISPQTALAQHAEGEIDLAPPTWVSLYQLTQFGDISSALSTLRNRAPRYYQTRLGKDGDDTRVAMWHGDAGYDDWDATVRGETHRLVMKPGGFQFLHSAIEY